MPQQDWLMLIGAGGLFLLLGLGAIIRGRIEEKSYYDSLHAHPDLREFLEHLPKYPEFAALKIGGWLAITIGLVMLAMSGVFWLWG